MVLKKKVWIAKSSDKGDDEDVPLDDKEEVEAEEDEREACEVITSPILLEKAVGPIYERLHLLRIFERSYRDTREESGVALKERPAEGEAIQGDRRTLREAKKAENKLKRANSAAEDAATSSALAAGEVSPMHLTRAENEEALSSPEGTKIALSLELPRGGGGGGAIAYTPAPVTPMDLAYMTYLNSMYSSAMPYGGVPNPGYTTVMLRNIPNRYTRDMLVERLNSTFRGQFDFVYLPIDFNSKCNVGYAFINFRTPAACQRFVQEFNGVKTRLCLPHFSSQKVCEVSYARVQGRDANMENLRDEKFIENLIERPEWQPLFLDDAGVEVSFSKTVLGSTEGRRRTRSRGESFNSTPKHGPVSAPRPPPPPPMPIGAGFMMPPYGALTPTMGMWMPPYGAAQPHSTAAALLPAAPTPREPPPLSFAAVVPGASPQRTLMLRHVPFNMSRNDVIERLNEDFALAYNFVYLPVGPKGDTGFRSCRSFMFINFRTEEKAADFIKVFNGVSASICFPAAAKKTRGESKTKKACEVLPARIASLEKSLARLCAGSGDASASMDSAWLPLVFDERGHPSPFPFAAACAAAAPGVKEESVIRAVLSNALDSRDLEKNMQQQAKVDDSGETSAEGPVATGEAPAAAVADPGEGEAAAAAPAASSSGAPPRTPAAAAARSTVNPMLPAMAMGYPAPGYPMGYPPWPQSPVHALSPMSAVLAAQAAAVAQAAAAAQANASAQAARYAASAAGATAGVDPTKLDTTKEGLRKQIEFYFSVDNLCGDLYLRGHMDSEGWAPVDLIASFPKVKKYGAPQAEILKVLASSETVEVNLTNDRVRPKNWKQWAQKAPREPDPAPATDAT